MVDDCFIRSNRLGGAVAVLMLKTNIQLVKQKRLNVSLLALTS